MKTTLFMYFIITLVVILIVYFTLRRIGIIEKPKPKEIRDAEADSIRTIKDLNQMVIDFKKFRFWDPSTMNEIPFPQRMTFKEATNIATQIEDSWGWLNDNEKQIYAAFERIPRQRDVASVAYYYQNLFDGRSLFADLVDKLNNNEIRILWAIIDKKPV